MDTAQPIFRAALSADEPAVVLETPRMQLRKAVLEDAGFFVQLLNDPSWLRNIGDRGIRSQADAKGYITHSILTQYHTYGFGMYVMLHKALQEPIGLCGLVKRDYLDHPDVGFAVLPDFSGKGYAFEAASNLMAYACGTLNIRQLYAIVNSSNERSIRLLEHLKFRHDGQCATPQGVLVERYIADAAAEWH
jgi:[ribosomal protein S5]-alanine N-acetyltransferase